MRKGLLGIAFLVACSNPTENQQMGRENMVNRANWRTPREELVQNPPAGPNQLDRMISLLNRIRKKDNSGILDGQKGQIVNGTSVKLNVPSALAGSIQGVPNAPSATTSFTNVLECGAESESSPEVITLSINPTLPQLTSTTAIDQYDVKALIEWGTNGSLERAFVDVNNGTQVSILGTYVRVSGIYTGLNLGTPIPGGPQLPPVTLSVGASYGTRPGSNNPPTWTGIVVQPAAGAAASINIPPFAVDVQAYCIDRVAAGFPSAAMTLVMRGGLVVPDGVKFSTTQPANSFPVYRIPEGAVFIDVNHALVNAANIILVFGLQL